MSNVFRAILPARANPHGYSRKDWLEIIAAIRAAGMRCDLQTGGRNLRTFSPAHTGPRSIEVAAWLSQERSMRFQTGHLTLPLGEAFDAVVYFDRATRAVRSHD